MPPWVASLTTRAAQRAPRRAVERCGHGWVTSLPSFQKRVGGTRWEVRETEMQSTQAAEKKKVNTDLWPDGLGTWPLKRAGTKQLQVRGVEALEKAA